jgi:hypothetical protein
MTKLPSLALPELKQGVIRAIQLKTAISVLNTLEKKFGNLDLTGGAYGQLDPNNEDIACVENTFTISVDDYWKLRQKILEKYCDLDKRLSPAAVNGGVFEPPAEQKSRRRSPKGR